MSRNSKLWKFCTLVDAKNDKILNTVVMPIGIIGINDQTIFDQFIMSCFFNVNSFVIKC